MTSKRNNRLSGEIKKIITNIIRTQLKDPRISSLVSIIEVMLTEDLRYAKIYISVYGDDESLNSTIIALRNAKGYIRRELGKVLKTHYTPELIFEKDTSITNAIKMNKLIEDVMSKERKAKNDNE